MDKPRKYAKTSQTVDSYIISCLSCICTHLTSTTYMYPVFTVLSWLSNMFSKVTVDSYYFLLYANLEFNSCLRKDFPY